MLTMIWWTGIGTIVLKGSLFSSISLCVEYNTI